MTIPNMSVNMYIGLFLFLSFLAFQLFYIAYPLFKKRGVAPLDTTLKQSKISILIPAYNEEAVVENCLESMLALNYDNYEAVFVNDGSSDQTLPLLEKLLDAVPIPENPSGKLIYAPTITVYKSRKYPNMILIDKVNGGKADSLNAAIDYASGDVVITLDADSVLEENALHYVNQSFQDEEVIGAGGMVHVGQVFNEAGKKKFKGKGLVLYQLSDYLNSFYLRKSTQASINVLAIVSGAFGAFRRDVLYDIGGYKKTLGEDMEITLNLQQYIKQKFRKGKLIFIPEAVCYTEVPENFRDSFKQKTRWQKGFIDCMVKYKKAFFTGGFTFKFILVLLWDSLMQGVTGIITLCAFPLIVIFKTYDAYFLTLVALSFVFQVSSRLIAYQIANRYGYSFYKMSYVKLFFFSLFETFTFRLMDPVIFAYGSVNYFLSKDKHNWNKVKRLGTVGVKSRDM